MKGCPWWIRWWHRLLRESDRKTMWPAIVARAAGRPDPGGTALLAWDRFTQQPGQEHWHCPCAEGSDHFGEALGHK